MGTHLLFSTRFRIYLLLWTSACLTHFTWQSFDYSVVCLQQEVIREQLSGSTHNGTSELVVNFTEGVQDSLKWLGPAFASWSAGTLVINLPAGYLIDRFGVRFVFGFGMPLAAALNCFIPHALYHTLPGLCFLRFLTGAFTQGIRGSAQNSVAGKWTPITELGLLIGVGSVFSCSGNVLANTIGATLCSGTSVGWPGLFYGAAILQTIWFVTWWTLYSERPEWDKKISEEELCQVRSSRSFRAGLQSAPHLPVLKQGQQVPWCKIVTSKPVWAASMSRFANAWLTALVATYGPTFFHTTSSNSLILNSLYASLPFLGNLSVRLTAGLLSDKSMKHMSKTNSLKLFNTLAFGSASICMGIGAFTICQEALINAVVLVTAFSCLGANIAGSFKSPVLLAPRYAGTLTGAMEVLSSVGSIVSLNSIAILASDGRTSQWRTISAFSCVFSAVAMVVFLLFGSGECQQWADPMQTAQWSNYQYSQKSKIEEFRARLSSIGSIKELSTKSVKDLRPHAEFEPLNGVPLLGKNNNFSNSFGTHSLGVHKMKRCMFGQEV